jgi:serine/threonine-protein kinase
MAAPIARLTESPTVSRGERRRLFGRPVAETHPTLDPALDELERTLLRHAATSTAVLSGRVGSGRTTTLGAFAVRCRLAGYAVATARGDGRTAPRAYAPIAELVAALLEDHDDGEAKATLEPIARAGYAELLRPVGTRGLPHAARVTAVAEAVAAFVRRAAHGCRKGRALLLLDDAGNYDELTLAVLHEVEARCAHVACLVLVAEDEGLLAWFPQAPRLTVGAHSTRLKLHDALIRRLGIAAGAEPPTIPECVAMLLDRADAAGRAAAQALSVLASPATATALAALACRTPERAHDEAVATGLATRGESGAQMHALVRELVAASIPAEVRRALHDRALEWQATSGAPVEARAHHAIWGGDAFGALLLLEEAGALALRRGDAAAAALWFGRGLERARRELAVSGDETFEAGVLSFTRRLVDALIAGDRLREAEGLLAEAEGRIGPTGPERARLGLLRARILARRSPADAVVAFEELLGSEIAKHDAALAVECARCLADARRSSGDARGAALALEAAAHKQERLDVPVVERASLSLALAEALATSGAPGRARAELDRAVVFARRAGAPALASRALAAFARLHQVDNRLRESIDALERAARAAEEAGDADALVALRDELAEARARASVPAPSTSQPGPRRVVLVVEDDVETQEVLWDCLTEQGYTVHAAHSGTQALRLLGSIDRPIAILVDLMMPVMDGWNFLAALRDHATYADIPVTVVSAFADKAPEGVARLTKPVDLASLLHVLASAEARGTADVTASR